MLDAETLALRIRNAMDHHKPQPITAAQLAEAFDVSAQAIHGWRKKGRIAKGKLLKLARLTGKPASYFLGDDIDESTEAQAFKLAEDWLSLTNVGHREQVRELLDKYIAIQEQFPELKYTMDDDKVSRHIAPAGKPASVMRVPVVNKPKGG